MRGRKKTKSLNHLGKLCPHYLSSRVCSCTLEVSRGHRVACKPAVHPGKHAVQLCFFRPGLRVGGCAEVLANTLLGVFHWLVLSEVSVSPTLIQGPWSARCRPEQRSRAGRLWPILIFPSSPMLFWAPCVWSETVSVMYPGSQCVVIIKKKSDTVPLGVWFLVTFSMCLFFWQEDVWQKVSIPSKVKGWLANWASTIPPTLCFSTWVMNFGAALVSGVNQHQGGVTRLPTPFYSSPNAEQSLYFRGNSTRNVHCFVILPLVPCFVFPLFFFCLKSESFPLNMCKEASHEAAWGGGKHKEEEFCK